MPLAGRFRASKLSPVGISICSHPSLPTFVSTVRLDKCVQGVRSTKYRRTAAECLETLRLMQPDVGHGTPWPLMLAVGAGTGPLQDMQTLQLSSRLVHEQSTYWQGARALDCLRGTQPNQGGPNRCKRKLPFWESRPRWTKPSSAAIAQYRP